MSPLFPARRRAQEFHDALEGQADAAAAERHAELLQAVEQVRSVPLVTPRPEATAALRERLMAEADVALVPSTDDAVLSRLALSRPGRAGSPSRRTDGDTRTRERRLGTVAAALVLVGSTAGLAAAAQGSLPGETLYPLKRAIETAQVGLAGNNAARGTDELAQATTRLEEARRLLVVDPGSARAATALEEFTRGADEGSALLFSAYADDSRQAEVDVVRTFTSDQMGTLERLGRQDGVPAEVQQSLATAAGLLSAIDQQAVTLCGTCGSGPGLDPPPALAPDPSGTADALASLITAPTRRAQVDAVNDALKAARGLGRDTGATGGSPTALPGTVGGAAGSSPSRPSAPPATVGRPDTSGQVVPGPVTGAVDGLLGTVTGTARDAAKAVTGSTGRSSTATSPLDAVPDAVSTVPDAVEDTLGAVDGILGGQG